MKDWQLLLLAAGIIAIEVAYTIPLLVLIHINGDTAPVIDESRPPFTNVSSCNVVHYRYQIRIRGGPAIHNL